MYSCMFFHRILEFTTSLRDSIVHGLAKHDLTLLEQINTQFGDKLTTPHSNEKLSHTQIQWLTNLFADRLPQIIDAIDDYTINQGGSNEHWIKLARDLVVGPDKTGLHILIPTLINITGDSQTLSKPTDFHELPAFYFSDDGKTLCGTHELLERFQNAQTFHTFKDHKKNTSRPLSLLELLRIRSKTGNLDLEVSSEKYDSFWDYITKKIAPGWHKRGEVPRQLLRPLLELVALYFKEQREFEKPRTFPKELLLWSKYLKDCRVDDVNCLYGQIITVDGKSDYLVNVLLDCFQSERSNLNSKMIGILSWLCHFDPSLIVNLPEARSTYIALEVGPGFNLGCLKQFIIKHLLNGASSELKKRIEFLLERLDSITEFDPENQEINTAIVKMYRERWREMQIKNESYSSLQHKQWVTLAKLLCGAGYTGQTNHYYLLMPTLKRLKDPIQQVDITDYDLSHSILSDDNTEFILLDNCVARLKIDRTFYNCNSLPPRPLTLKEIERMQHANTRFHRYIPLAYCRAKDDPQLALSTVLAVKSLVDASLFPDGLQYAHDYDDAQLEASRKAYQLFYNFLRQLPKDEKLKLESQNILFRGKLMTVAELLLAIKPKKIPQDGWGMVTMSIDPKNVPFVKLEPTLKNIDAIILFDEKLFYADLLTKKVNLIEVTDTNRDDFIRLKSKFGDNYKTVSREDFELVTSVTGRTQVEDEEGMCIALADMYFAQLVMDYAPHFRFRKEIELKVDVDEMRTHSVRKVYINDEKAHQQEAERRLKALMVSIMTSNLQYLPIGQNLSIWDCSHTITDTTKSIAQLIMPMVLSGDFKKSRGVFHTITNEIVKPALAAREASWLTWMTQSNTTHRWLQSILDFTLFTEKNTWFDPELLLKTLSPMTNINSSLRVCLLSFLDDLVHTYSQPQSLTLKEIRVNIKFSRLLQTLDYESRRKILEALELSSRDVGEKDFYNTYTNYVVHRLVQLGTSSTTYSHQKSFFIPVVSCDKGKLVEILTEMTRHHRYSNMGRILFAFGSRIESIDPSICAEQAKLKMFRYLQDMRRPIVENPVEDQSLTSYFGNMVA